jgi:rRNA maturation endonuclease Nob1
MDSKKECPICGCKEIGKGRLSAIMEPANKPTYKTFFTGGSIIEADICTKCGHVLSLRVAKPEKFK